MGIQRWGKDGVDYRLVKSDEGHFVMFTDHEQVVAELRAELAAKSKDAEALMNSVREHGHSMTNSEIAEHLIAMGEGNGR